MAAEEVRGTLSVHGTCYDLSMSFDAEELLQLRLQQRGSGSRWAGSFDAACTRTIRTAD